MTRYTTATKVAKRRNTTSVAQYQRSDEVSVVTSNPQRLTGARCRKAISSDVERSCDAAVFNSPGYKSKYLDILSSPKFQHLWPDEGHVKRVNNIFIVPNKDGNVNHSSEPYHPIRKGYTSKMSSAIRRYRATGLLNRHQKQNPIGRHAVKRKHDGKTTKGRVLSSRNTKADNGPKERTFRNRNNSKGQRRSSHVSNSSRAKPLHARKDPPETVTVHMVPPMQSPGFALPPGPHMAPGLYPPSHYHAGNPLILERPPVQWGNPSLSIFPPPACPHDFHHTHQPHQRQETSARASTSQKDDYNPDVQKTLQKKIGKMYSYKPMCQEYPLVYGCGRWHRLQMQDAARRQGFLPLLKVMFCCCCNNNIEES